MGKGWKGSKVRTGRSPHGSTEGGSGVITWFTKRGKAAITKLAPRPQECSREKKPYGGSIENGATLHDGSGRREEGWRRLQWKKGGVHLVGKWDGPYEKKIKALVRKIGGGPARTDEAWEEGRPPGGGFIEGKKRGSGRKRRKEKRQTAALQNETPRGRLRLPDGVRTGCGGGRGSGRPSL